MSELGKVLGSLLRDIAQAQDISNRYSVKLSKTYKKHELLHYFPVPNAILTEVEIDFKFAVLDVEEENGNIRSSVIVEAAQLAEFAPEIISSVKFGTKIRDFKWVREDDNGGSDEILIDEDS